MAPKAAAHDKPRRRLPSARRSAELYTVGYGGRSAEALVRLLREHRVTIVCDVRFSPRSRFVPWANYYVVRGDGPLKQLVEEADLEYVWMGEQLGNPQPKDASLRRFSALM